MTAWPRGNMLQPKRGATFQVQNLHLNRFINPKVQIQRREGRKGRREEFGESGTKIAPLNTSFLFWTFSQRLLNLPRFIEGKKKKSLYPLPLLCARTLRRHPCCGRAEPQLQLSSSGLGPQRRSRLARPFCSPRNSRTKEAPVGPAQ